MAGNKKTSTDDQETKTDSKTKVRSSKVVKTTKTKAQGVSAKNSLPKQAAAKPAASTKTGTQAPQSNNDKTRPTSSPKAHDWTRAPYGPGHFVPPFPPVHDNQTKTVNHDKTSDAQRTSSRPLFNPFELAATLGGSGQPAKQMNSNKQSVIIDLTDDNDEEEGLEEPITKKRRMG